MLKKRFNGGTRTGSMGSGGFGAGFRAPGAIVNLIAPAISGTLSIGNTLTCSTGSYNVTPGSYSYQWKRAGVNIGGATSSSYVVTSSDLGPAITCSVTASKGALSLTTSSNSITYALTQISGLKYLIGNTSTDGAFSSIIDASPNARTLSVSATTSARPVGFPRNWEQNGLPVIGFNGGLSQYAQDQAGDAITYINFLHQAGVGIIWRGEIRNSGPIFGNWGGATSNQNAISLEHNGNSLIFYCLSKTAGGTTHFSATTNATPTNIDSVRIGDVVTVTVLHNSNKTWSVEIIREARDTTDSRRTITISGSYVTTIDSTAASFGFTEGAYGGLATFGQHRTYALAVFTIGASTTSDVANAKAFIANKCNFEFLSYDASSPLIFAADGSQDYPAADGTHWNDSGHSKVGTAGRSVEQALATAQGLTGTVRVGVLGDSRFSGTGASSVGTTSSRAVLAAGSYTYTRVASGPVNDGSGSAAALHFARSAYITRSNSLTAQLGHSQRGTHANSIDAYVGNSRSFNNINIWHDCIGINEIVGVSTAASSTYDWVDEWVRLTEYRITQQQTYGSIIPMFVLYTEAVTGSTTTGFTQRLIRARNRGYHAAVRYIKTLTNCSLINLNDSTYNP